ncbi:MAG: AbrB/MazE/SpoVT family DNA-binding domain-containing protein, partial [Candidatus Woesearchaeota archaeon]
MKKYPKIVQCDKRGQIVIPKEIRQDLGIDEGCGFWVFSITDEGILLKKMDAPQLH